MNTGIIAARYANALLLLTQESGRGEQVCNQIRSLLDRPDDVPESLEPDLVKLVTLLKKNNRSEYLKLVFRSFVDRYYESVGIRLAHLTTAVPVPDLEKRLCELVQKRTGYRVIMETSVDPALIGGFVLEIDNYMLDASVRTEIETLRREFIEKNTRLV